MSGTQGQLFAAPRVYVDPPFYFPSRDPVAYRVGSKHGHRWSHLWCDPGHEAALHDLARRIGMRREWFQDQDGFPHYDLVPPRREAALREGAIDRPLAEWLRERRARDTGPVPSPVVHS